MKLSKFSLIGAIILAGLLSVSVIPASAVYLNAGTSVANGSVSVSATLDTAARARADAAIDARVTRLNALEARINQMTRVTTDEKTSLDATIQANLNDMVALKAKINADTDNVTLKADIQSITKSYRIYVLVLPQANIMAAADRVMFIVGQFNDLSAKLQARITAAQTPGQNVTSLNASLTDMNAKTADANVQAQAAINEVAALKPDNGDKTVFAANLAALKDARSKIHVAIQDLKTARQDAGSIVQALVAMKISASASAGASAQ